MKHVSSSLDPAQPIGSPKASQDEDDHKDLEIRKVEALWLLMARMFGHRWTSAYGEAVDPDGVWRAALRGIHYNLVKKGLERLSQSGMEWPPSAPEFRAMCRDDYGQDETHWERARVEAADRERPLRIGTKRTPEQIAAGHQRLEQILQEFRATAQMPVEDTRQKKARH